MKTKTSKIKVVELFFSVEVCDATEVEIYSCIGYIKKITLITSNKKLTHYFTAGAHTF